MKAISNVAVVAKKNVIRNNHNGGKHVEILRPTGNFAARPEEFYLLRLPYSYMHVQYVPTPKNFVVF